MEKAIKITSKNIGKVFERAIEKLESNDVELGCVKILHDDGEFVTVQFKNGRQGMFFGEAREKMIKCVDLQS